MDLGERENRDRDLDERREGKLQSRYNREEKNK